MARRTGRSGSDRPTAPCWRQSGSPPSPRSRRSSTASGASLTSARTRPSLDATLPPTPAWRPWARRGLACGCRGCLGRVRVGGAGDPRPADHGRGCNPAGWPTRAAHGAPLPAGDGPLRSLFSSAARLAGADLALGMPRLRAAAIVSLAACALATPGLFAPAPALDDALNRLKALPGIGEWTAQYIAMRALREPDAPPAADVGLLRAMATPATSKAAPSPGSTCSSMPAPTKPQTAGSD